MYIERVPNRNSPPAVLLRESYREGKKVKKRTLANLSKLPDEAVNNLKQILKGAKAVNPQQLPELLQVVRSLPHGHVAVILNSIKQLQIDQTIDPEQSRQRNLILAMIVARIINPASKLATARGFHADTAASSIGQVLGIEKATANELYDALDWLVVRQEKIENNLAQKHLQEGSLILYDLTSTYVEGNSCPLATYGYNRDRKKGKQQIVFGLICDRVGCPVAVEVFEGNTLDSKTKSVQVEKVRQRFGYPTVVWVGDRGIITQDNIEQEFQEQSDLDGIGALTLPQIKKLAEAKVIQLGLFDEQDLVALTSPDYPGERLIACRNPLVANKNRLIREELLQKTEAELEKIVVATKREKRALKGADAIGVRVGKVINRFQVGKFLEFEITEDSLTYRRKESALAEASALDGVYLIRTSLAESEMSASETVQVYKSLSQVEFAFRCLKTVDLQVRPIYHRNESRVKAHIFLCMLAYYVEWHLRQVWSSLLFTAEEESEKFDLVPESPDSPFHSFATLLADLGTITTNKIKFNLQGQLFSFEKITQPTTLQQKALDLAGVSLICTQ